MDEKQQEQVRRISRMRDTLTNLINSGVENDYEVWFYAMISVAAELTLLMRDEYGEEVFVEHGSAEKWFMAMAKISFNETDHAMALRGMKPS